MKKKQPRLIWWLSAILLLVSVGVVYVTHRAVPFMMDDLWYSTVLSSEEPLASFDDIVQSQIWHYHNWGGRSMTHGMLQLILMTGEAVADVLNVVTTLLLTYMICVMTGYRKLPAYFVVFGMLFGLNANWKMSMFWQSGAANYLYITIFILLFLYCYLREVQETECIAESKALPGIPFWIIPLGIVSGWSNENMGPAVWIISFLVILIQWKEKRCVKPWMILGNISCLIGSILVVVAPGNFVRSAEAASNNYGALWNLFLRCYAEAQAALNYLFPALVLLTAVLIMGKGILRLSIGKRNRLLLLCALLSWGAMVLSPHYPDRATFGTMVLLICVILSMTREILKVRKDLSMWLFGAALLVWLRGMFYLGEYLAVCWGWIR